MPSYAAFLGHQPLLSLSELHACLPDLRQARLAGRSIALFETAKPIDPAAFKTWGGILLLAENISGKLSLSDIPAALITEVKGKKGKVTFAIRTEGIGPRVVHDLYRDCKGRLKKEGIPSRYVGNEHKPAATALLRDAGLLDGSEGVELVIIKGEHDLWVGKTIAAQDPDEYTRRDMEKPVRDTKVGLLPPKLAQVMLNFGWMLAGGEKRTGPLTVLDPFCGTGVIPLEVGLRGWHILACDLSQKAVSGCEKNLEWMRKIYKIKKSDVQSEVWKQDATKPFSFKVLPDVVVSETTLGPALEERAMVKDAKNFKSESENVELAFLQNAAKTLPGVPLVLTWPVWYLKTGTLRLEKTWAALEKLGYTAVPPPGISVEDLERPSLIYRRGEQFVGREIVLLQPKKVA